MTPPDDRDPVDVLAEDFADRLRRGEHPSVSDYADLHPEHAEQLRQLLPAVAQMENLKRFRRGAEGGRTEMPDRFGDFRIVRELGRGGMGVVFEAVQESLGRPVALKVLAAHAQLDATRRNRFVREAQAAARLHHTNIVPVFGVGEQDGIPYYVMQLIRGEGLHAVATRWRFASGKNCEQSGSTVEFGKIDTRPDHTTAAPVPAEENLPRYGNWAFVAETGLQAADALHYAHLQGVLHRDVKPANLILDPIGRVWVADFGLAKLVNTHALTATGDILGTLQYLAPECLHGESDARSDVYGLGATLYELLTLQPPYPMDNPARLVKAVADAGPPRPRQINPDIPRDLETIVLKAMAREPHRRYATARDLARDLQAFIEDRPITARRESPAGRAWRWCRRNPTVAILSVNMAAALVLAGVVGWVGYANTRQALEAEGRRREEAEAARADALLARNEAVLASERLEANLKLSLDAFSDVFEAAAGTRDGFGFGTWARPFGGGPPPMGPPPPPQGGPVGPGFLGLGGGPGGRGPASFVTGEVADKAAILEAILAFYERFARQNATHHGLQFEAARAYRRVGEAHGFFAKPEKAAVAFRRARDILEDLHARYPDDSAMRLELIETYLYMPMDGRGGETEKFLFRALELADTPQLKPRGHLIGSIWFKIGWAREQTHDRTGAEQAYRRAEDGLAADAAEDLRPTPVVIERALARERIASMMIEDSRFREARELLTRSAAELRDASARRALSPRPPREINGMLAMTLNRQAEVCELLQDAAAAAAARKEAKSLMDRAGPAAKKDGPPRKS